MSAVQRIRSSSRGQALAEFALAFPVVVLIIIGVFDVGRAVFTYNAITNAAREGARLAIVNQDVPTIQSRTLVQGAGVVAAPSDVQVTFLDTASGDPCDGAGSHPILSIGCTADVRVTAQWQAITPLIGNLIGPLALTADAALPVEFVCGVASAPITNPASCPKQAQ
jgi:Flp pilus assembly protein TadG